jgi:hypothetical protein
VSENGSGAARHGAYELAFSDSAYVDIPLLVTHLVSYRLTLADRMLGLFLLRGPGFES